MSYDVILFSQLNHITGLQTLPGDLILAERHTMICYPPTGPVIVNHLPTLTNLLKLCQIAVASWPDKQQKIFLYLCN